MSDFNRTKVDNLTRYVQISIEMKGLENNLDDKLIEDIFLEALKIFPQTKYTDAEIDEAKHEILARYEIEAIPGESILNDYDADDWYDDAKSQIDPKLFNRYKNYLIDSKKFSPNIISYLSENTLDQKLMNCLLDPNKKYPNNMLRRGLVIGDVQSGKTSTYLGLMCKAADAGYKVFILLTGITESLRCQTQERVEEGIIGIDISKGINYKVGVGMDGKPVCAMSFTSRVEDFIGSSDKKVTPLSSEIPCFFVIKKNIATLEKLTDWLIKINGDSITKKIDLPMLLIDDEADNASINTSKNKEDPTKINKQIRKLANVFTKSNYVGFTATPFANVFIDPETNEKMENQDLFPEDFIVSLPTPTNYIGPRDIFSPKGKYNSQVRYIRDAGINEEDGFPFYFKHSKNWEDELPNSLTDAIYTFYIANAIRDLKGDKLTHRSMLVNISRFIDVQKYVQSKIEVIHKKAYSSIKFNLDSNNLKLSLTDPILKRIYEIWKNEYSSIEDWKNIAKVLFNSIENIQIQVVNSSKNSQKLEYLPKTSVRVIAIGGLALSRGLTLEGLLVSYFYRNTSTYDVLMQMGRWFGYRDKYKELFRIWTHISSAEWYDEIAEATEQLKLDMTHMRDLKKKPKDFGIRVRNNSSELSITAANKMRNTSDEVEIFHFFGNIVETPYLTYLPEDHIYNYDLIDKLIQKYLDNGAEFERQNGKGHYLLQNVSKNDIIEILKELKISKYNTFFDPKQIISFLSNCLDKSLDKFDVAFMDGEREPENTFNFKNKIIYKVNRSGTAVFDLKNQKINVSSRGKLGGTLDGLAGICDFGGEKAQKIIEKAKDEFKEDYKKKNDGLEFSEGKSYPLNTWFKYVEKRKPLFLVYFLSLKTEQFNDFNNQLNGIPPMGFAIGFPRNNLLSNDYICKYKTNRKYNWFEMDNNFFEMEEE